ncbi:MAG: (d)CMP kinase [Streptosporangiales bacterium]|nr:(d)CMP kinase [Streptosporangiales bacterium]
MSAEQGSAVVAVDGPSGSGKSSVARAVAAKLGLRYLDTGAMYRAVTWWMLEHDVPVDDAGAVTAAIGRPVLEVTADPAEPRFTVDGVDVDEAIRTREVTNAVSAVSAVPATRERLVAEQRAIIGAGGIVVEGRDIGTVVAPDATVKVYLVADEEVRAARRVGDSNARLGTDVTVTRTEQARRDAADAARKSSPLAKADDAVEVDSTELGFAEVVDRVLDLVREATERHG